MAKSKYESHVKPYLTDIPKWRKQGKTELEVCKKLGISEQTKENYKKQHIEFFESMKKGKEDLIVELYDSLYKRAMGYEYEETTTEVQDGQFGQTKKIKKIKKHSPPDVGALCVALRNLDNNFKDHAEKNISDNIRPVTVVNDLGANDED